MIRQGSSFTKVSKLTNSTIQQLNNIQSLQTFSSRYRDLKLDFCNATVILWIASAAARIGVHSGWIQMDLLFSAHSNRIIKQLMIVLTASCHESIIYGLDQSRRYREPVSVPPPSVCKWQQQSPRICLIASLSELCGLELETNVIRRFPKISQSQIMPLRWPSHG